MLVVDLCDDNQEERLPEPSFADIDGCKIPQIKLDARRESLHIIVELVMARLSGKRDGDPLRETWCL